MEQQVSAGWRKSSYSSGNGGACVEVGNISAGIAVRDTTDRAGGTLSIPSDAWKTFTARLK
jgi:hypothetical protein